MRRRVLEAMRNREIGCDFTGLEPVPRDFEYERSAAKTFLPRREESEIRFHRQQRSRLIKAYKRIMSSSPFARKIGVCCSLLAVVPALAFGQNLVPTGTEYLLTGSLPGDQVHPQLSFNSQGGFVVWQDNAIDGNGLGIGAMRVGPSLSGSGTAFRVNQITANDQENPQVSLFNDGSAAFTWQGGPSGYQHIYTRFLSASNTWTTGDVLVSPTNYSQISPVSATLSNGNVVILWASQNEAAPGSMLDVYGKIFTPAGQIAKDEFLVNQLFTANNQRSPAVAALADGRFIAAWVSEQERWTDASNGVPSVDIYARFFDANGVAQGNELLFNASSNICAYPDIAPSADGGFMAVWMEKDPAVKNNGWDIYACRFSSLGVPSGVIRVNTQLYGDQYSPKIRRAGSSYLVVWTSMGQDGSKEGVFGQYLNDDGSLLGSEFQVNSTSFGSQMHQALGSDGAGRILAVWTSFSGHVASGFDLYAQRYLDPSLPLYAPAPPTITATSNSLTATWGAVGGLGVTGYQLYADGNTNTPVFVGSDLNWTTNGLPLGSTHSFQLAYVIGSQQSPLSQPASGTTVIVTNSAANGDPNGNPGSVTNSVTPPLVLPSPKSQSGAVTNSFADVAGVYNGLFFDANGVTAASSGYFTAKTTASGGFSAKLQIGGQSCSFSGQFDASGNSTNTVVTKTLGTLTIQLAIDLHGGYQITGTIISQSWVATVVADRAGFNKLQPPAVAGRYTFVIPSGNATIGTGIGTAVIDSAGNVQWSATLADGTVIGQKTTLSKDNEWPLYAGPYNGAGVFLGWMEFSGTTNFTGSCVWVKPTAFAKQVTVIGSSYSMPPGYFRVFGNSKLSFVGGGLATSFTNNVYWGTDNKIINQSASALSMSLAPTTGLFKGTATVPGTGQKLSFQGVLFKNDRAGYGLFPGSNGSGQVNFAPAQ